MSGGGGREIVIFGAGGQARETLGLVRQCGDEVVAFVDRHPAKGACLHGIPVLSAPEAHHRWPAALALAAAGYAAVRRRLVQEATEAGFGFATVVSPTVSLDSSLWLGPGTVIQSGAVLTVDSEVGAHVLVNCGATIAHDVWIGDHVTLSPGARLLGAVRVEADAFIGAGAVIGPGRASAPVVIGQGATVGAQAYVKGSVGAGQTVAGVPARPLAGGGGAA